MPAPCSIASKDRGLNSPPQRVVVNPLPATAEEGGIFVSVPECSAVKVHLQAELGRRSFLTGLRPLLKMGTSCFLGSWSCGRSSASGRNAPPATFWSESGNS